MATLQKIKEAQTTEAYTVTVTRDIDLMSIINTYKTCHPKQTLSYNFLSMLMKTVGQSINGTPNVNSWTN